MGWSSGFRATDDLPRAQWDETDFSSSESSECFTILEENFLWIHKVQRDLHLREAKPLVRNIVIMSVNIHVFHLRFIFSLETQTSLQINVLFIRFESSASTEYHSRRTSVSGIKQIKSCATSLGLVYSFSASLFVPSTKVQISLRIRAVWSAPLLFDA